MKKKAIFVPSVFFIFIFLMASFVTFSQVYAQNNGVTSDPSITVLSPNGGEEWEIGKTYKIEWNSQNVNRAYINLHRTSSAYEIISGIAVLPDNPGFYNWTVPELTVGDTYRFKVFDPDSGVTDLSDNYFSIVEAGTSSITVLSPNGGESIPQGSTYTIQWTGGAKDSLMKISLVRKSAGSAGLTTLVESAANTGSYVWSVSSAPILKHTRVPALPKTASRTSSSI